METISCGMEAGTDLTPGAASSLVGNMQGFDSIQMPPGSSSGVTTPTPAPDPKKKPRGGPKKVNSTGTTEQAQSIGLDAWSSVRIRCSP